MQEAGPSILVVCTANICRSPMFEALLQAYLDRNADTAGTTVASAGTRARPDHAAASGMRRVASSWGLDLDGHRSRRVDHDIATGSDLVVTMEQAHSDAVSRLAPGLGSRTFLVTELDAIIGAQTVAPADADGLAELVANWHAARARLSLDAPDVADPIGGSPQEYEQCAWQLARLTERLGPTLATALT